MKEGERSLPLPTHTIRICFMRARKEWLLRVVQAAVEVGVLRAIYLGKSSRIKNSQPAFSLVSFPGEKFK